MGKCICIRFWGRRSTNNSKRLQEKGKTLFPSTSRDDTLRRKKSSDWPESSAKLLKSWRIVRRIILNCILTDRFNSWNSFLREPSQHRSKFTKKCAGTERTAFLRHKFYVKNKIPFIPKAKVFHWEESSPHIAACPGVHEEQFFSSGSFFFDDKNNRRELGKWFSIWWSVSEPFRALCNCDTIAFKHRFVCQHKKFRWRATNYRFFVEIKIVSYGRNANERLHPAT